MEDVTRSEPMGKQTLDYCTECQTHQTLLDKLETPLGEEKYQKLAEIFKNLGDPTRVKIIHALAQTELCVCDLAELLMMTQSAISHQLRILRNNRLVKYRKEGRTVFYSLDDDHIMFIFKQGLAHVLHD